MNSGTLYEDREQWNGFGGKSLYLVLICTEYEMPAILLSGNSE